jgi:hypothetical protein
VIYELIGRIIIAFLWRAYRREIRIAAGAGLVLAALGIGAYLATREDEEEADRL